jgi:EpsI family protein
MPDEVGPWRVSPTNGVVIPTAEVPDNTGYDGLLTRLYADGNGRTVMFLLAHSKGQAGGTQLHRPEVCYPAAGFEMHDLQTVTVGGGGSNAIHGRAITGIKPGRIEHVLYWSRVGTAFPTTTVEQSLATLRQSLGGRAPDGALVRMSMIATDRGSTLTRLNQFANALLDQRAPGLQLLLTGRA